MMLSSNSGFARAYRNRRKTHPGQVFVRVVFMVLLVALGSILFFRDDDGGQRLSNGHRLIARDVGNAIEQDEACHLVYKARDQCAFIKANCEDEEAGLLSYLDLYYCRLPQAKPVAFGIISLWLGLLFSTIGIAASDFFCINLSTISTLLGLSESLAGVTFLAFGNGSPDVFSTFAAMGSDSGSLAIGELLGAAGFITTVVAGSMAFVRPFKVSRKSFVRDVGCFIIAVSFSLVFLYDGKLYLWESVAMVCLYIIYVVFVVSWHWWRNRRRRRRQIETAARSHYTIPGSGEVEFHEQYHDEEEDGDARDRLASSSRTLGGEDFDVLERGNVEDDEDEDVEEDVQERVLGEISSNMRIKQPRQGERRHTHNPIRPSLLGALEFRSVLSALNRSSTIQAIPLGRHLRRYSDGPGLALGQDQTSIAIDQDILSGSEYRVDAGNDHQRPPYDRHTASGNRIRAVSANHIETLRPQGPLAGRQLPRIDLEPFIDEQPAIAALRGTLLGHPEGLSIPPPSPTISLSPPPSNGTSRDPSPAPRPVPSPTLLVPLENPLYGTQHSHHATGRSTQNLPKLSIPTQQSPSSSETSSFPAYIDHTPSATPSRSLSPSLRHQYVHGLASTTSFQGPVYHASESERPLSWWPYSIVPPLESLLSTLFPTLFPWRQKNLWEMIIGIAAAPSVFLLTITLPVIESETDESSVDDIPDLTLQRPTPRHEQSQSSSQLVLEGSVESSPRLRSSSHANRPSGSQANFQIKSISNTQPNATAADNGLFLAPMHISDRSMVQSPIQLPSVRLGEPATEDWNRWLIILQVFTAPLFIVLIIWANTSLGDPRALLQPSLVSLILSLIALAFILTTTRYDRAPKWRVLFCFLGFLVSIAWISTIAGEVVGVLKALGIILNISDAILGLTIFAVGNSLGDLVADITVAKLGYPVMALSACFGGPMLNILLGIGLSGMYMTIRGAQSGQKKHPGRKMKYEPFEIGVDRTLMVSGASLLVGLIGLLIAVPLRRWKMDRFVGWCLVILWLVSTVGNIGFELWGGGLHRSS